jgi:hypothetical protein
MPAEKRYGLHDSQGVPPVEPPPKPDQDKTGRVRRTPWLDVVLLIQRELLAEKQILRCQLRRRVQPESEEAPGVDDKRQQCGRNRPGMTEEAWNPSHRWRTPLRGE